MLSNTHGQISLFFIYLIISPLQISAEKNGVFLCCYLGFYCVFGGQSKKRHRNFTFVDFL